MDFTSGGIQNSVNRSSFLSHVFSTTEEGKAEILNVVQYALLGVIPVVLLNKAIQRFIPDADMDKSSLEILIEVLIQLVLMFCGIILIHRVITFIPTYSQFKYESLNLTTVILAFLVLVLSIQTKLGIKVNILVDRLSELWNGPSTKISKSAKSKLRVYESMSESNNSTHTPSQADYLDTTQPTSVFPPMPSLTSNKPAASMPVLPSYAQAATPMAPVGPAPANSLLGGSFGSF